MKPVTELYEEAEGWAQGVSDTHGEDGLLRAVGAIDRLAGSAGTSALLDVLDLVATLPLERLEEVRRCVEGDGERRWREALGPWNDDGVSVETCIGLMRRTLDAYKGLPQITSPQLGLVRWVAGLSDADLQVVRWALASGAGEAKAGGRDGDGERLGKMLTGLHDAISGGEGEAKCPECHGAGKVKRLEGGGSIRLVKYDPCPKCAEGDGGAKCPDCQGQGYHVVEHVSETERVLDQERCGTCDGTGEGGAKEEPRAAFNAELDLLELEARLSEVREKIRSYDGGDRPSSPPMRLFAEERKLLEAMERWSGAQELLATNINPTILPAGKPTPFLRVGMVLCVPGAPCGDIRIRGEEVDGRVQVSGIDGSTWLASVSRLRAEWVLAEPFTVEGES